MDKRKAWRKQEEQLVERWNAAAGQFRDAQAALSSRSSELEAVRKQVARIKVEFSAGKRY
jgi:ribosomal protein L29